MPFGSSSPDHNRIEQQRKGLRILFIIVAILILIGLLNVYSSTLYMNVEAGDNPYGYFIKQSVYLVLGSVFFQIMRKNKPELWGKLSGILSIGTIVLLLLVFVAGRTVNGATRWIALGPISIQPSEIAKLPAILWAARYLAVKMDVGKKITVFAEIHAMFQRSKNGKSSFVTQFLSYFKPLFMPLLMALLVIKQPDMGTAVMILAFPAMMYILAGMPFLEIICAGTLSIGTFLILALTSAYRKARLVVLWDPFSRASDLGYQTVQSLIAVGSGGILGQGAGQGFSKFFYLPEQHTDFAFAVFCQEWGLIGALFLLFLFVGFLYIGLRLASQVNNTYRMLLISGLTLLIGTQAFINMAMVIGCFPVTGIPLPFISYGGTSLVINLMAVGLIVGAVEYSMKEEEQKQRIILNDINY